ncbi:MAG: flagellar hook-length control protein FliK [Butyrivibrio sp.]|nr:flagellar hook-length control protein FliK [Butyrivibrio sp.]
MNIVTTLNSQNSTMNVDGSTLRDVRSLDKPLELKSGSTIQGTIVSVTDTENGKMANINIGDSVISAKLSDGMGLREGQTLNFAVKMSGASGINITPLYENTSVDQSTLKALTAAGIEITNDTIRMVKDMMEAGLPIGKNALLEMNRNLSMHPNTSISTMVEMKSLNIPVNDNNIVQFQSYKNYEHQVTNAMESIMDELPNAFSQMLSAGNTTSAINLYGAVLKLFGGENENTELNIDTTQLEMTSNLEGEASVQGKEGVISGNDILETELVNSENAKPQELLSNQQQVQENLKEDVSVKGQPFNTEGTAGDGTGASRNVLSDSFVNSLKNLGISDETINKYQQALLEDGKQTTDTATSSAGALKLETAQKELLKELAKNFENADLSNVAEKASWKNVFSSGDYNKLLKSNMASQWTLKPLEVQDKENVENLYQRLGNQVKGLTNAISQNLGTESKLFQQANNLQNNLDFMNQLNQMFQYVQLPLQMAGQNTHGDLYVYKNKNRKMSEDGSVSAVLHLDMDNLGPLDVYVKLKDTKVTTNFYVADDSILDLINDNIHILNERLEKRGYSMTVNLALHEDMDGQDAAVDEMLDVTKTPILSVNSFDARA